ncbi:MAG: metallophosphoesterase, partial [Actinomycetota bacterium]
RGTLRPLAGFKQVSDVHVIDEESPARVEYLDQCSSHFNAAYRVQEALSLQIGNSMLKQLARRKVGPATGVLLDFVISTGDNVDNNQFNETEDFVDLLDGEGVDPNSGGGSYDGYTQEEFSQALDLDILELAQKPFDSVGTGLPWYGVLGNHDGLAQGNVVANPAFNTVAIGGMKAFRSIEANEDCPEDPSDAQQVLDSISNALATDERAVPADPDRHFTDHEELVGQYFDTTGKPVGHGFADAPDDPLHEGERGGYYSFTLGKKITGISLDTVSSTAGPNGHIPDPQWQWLVEQLKKNSRSYLEEGEVIENPQAKDRMIVLFSHHSSRSLNNPGGRPEAEPYHCFEREDNPECAGGEGFRELLQRFPNVIAWVNGHEHNNRIRGHRVPEDQDQALGFWEINTAAHIDWPQQSRLIEIAWRPGRGADSVVIFATAVDHAAALAPKVTQSHEDRLASIARIEAYFDACVRTGQAQCNAPGGKRHRNARLVQKAPFDLGS